MMIIMMSHIIMAIIFIVVNYLNGTTFTLLTFKDILAFLKKKTKFTYSRSVVSINYESDFV